jgi:hypothetical protein
MKSLLVCQVLGTILCLGLAACASIQDVDRSLLSHPAMDFQQSLAPAWTSSFSRLDSIQSVGASGACTACAK